MLANVSQADVPKVATDISPVHSLVSIVMGNLGEPGLVVQSGASPHDFAFKPSQARMLQDADAVFWIGEDLTPWLSDPIQKLAGNAISVELLENPKTQVLKIEEDEHEEEESHDEHDHGHGEHDPHAWLDPENAMIWLDVIATHLTKLDPEHADIYAANATKGKLDIEKISAEASERLDEMADAKIVVAHDAYAYFADRYNLNIVGAITPTDDAAPSAGRVAKLVALVQSQNVKCILTDPLSKDGLIDVVVGKIDVKRATVDPLGAHLPNGALYYTQLIGDIAVSIETCFGN
ncbi:zinc ABC transporter substrate-binding protein [Amylibacter sp. SFDW26]|uniref:zinc ABC transporter substrate-binding protein n=1 Tax=Amylibacter sp. SFDW26 TaxID=2652722 RepID=UPI001869DDA7|nr:zinc ABC transporter substrate-binding protein [Amylibacter sp. SFDW26]